MENILMPVIITLSAGLVLGLLLAVIASVFEVKGDEKVEKVSEMLPGANCGGCGYAGCSDLARAIVEGKADPSLCSPGGEECSKKICEFLGISGDEFVSKKAFVHCAGCIDYTQDKMTYSGISTCVGANMFFQGKGKCDFGCLGFGDCVNACPFGAIYVKNDLARVERSLCVGCGKCVSVCPNKLIDLIPESKKVAVLCANIEKGALTRKACSHGCIGCLKCQKACPSDAIKIDNGFLARIDYEKCTDCGECQKICPTGAVCYIAERCKTDRKIKG